MLRIVEGANRKRVRARHESGSKLLDLLFDGPGRAYFTYLAGDQTGGGKPVRLRAGTPPVRDDEHQARHRKRRISNASRRRNRP